jgi:hypothetical protein
MQRIYRHEAASLAKFTQQEIDSQTYVAGKAERIFMVSHL